LEEFNALFGHSMDSTLRLFPNNPPRVFTVGASGIEIKDCGRLHLSADEQLTLMRDSGAEYDLVDKSWGFYANPSVNGRLVDFGLRTAIVRHLVSGRIYVLIVERGHEADFQEYLDGEQMIVDFWLDVYH